MEVLVNARCKLGENPLWNERTGRLYWTDIDAGKLHRYDAATGEHEVIYEGEKVGGFTLQEDDGLLLFRVHDIAHLTAGGKVKVLRKVEEAGMRRFNDVVATPQGEVLAGTIGETETSGGLYRFGRDGGLQKLFHGTGIANGMGFSPDLAHFYWTASTQRHLYRFDYDAETGRLGERTLIYEASEAEGTPDGLTVDIEGNLYSARYGGAALVKHAPDGRVLGRLELTVPNVTSACFGGASFDELFITTAGGGAEGASPEAGAVFRHKLGVKGRREFRSRVGI